MNDLAPIGGSNVEAVTKALSDRRQLLATLIDDKEDIQHIQGRDFKKKSYWRKLGVVYGLSFELRGERCEVGKQKDELVYHFTYRATAPNGQYSDGSGSCSTHEKSKPNTIHNTRATAETRAKNRCISDLLAWGEVSAEEVDMDRGDDEENQKALLLADLKSEIGKDRARFNIFLTEMGKVLPEGTEIKSDNVFSSMTLQKCTRVHTECLKAFRESVTGKSGQNPAA